jgi:hypothetical protein
MAKPPPRSSFSPLFSQILGKTPQYIGVVENNALKEATETNAFD